MLTNLKERVVMMQLECLSRLVRRFTVFTLSNHPEISSAFIEGNHRLMQDMVDSIKRTLEDKEHHYG